MKVEEIINAPDLEISLKTATDAGAFLEEQCSLIMKNGEGCNLKFGSVKKRQESRGNSFIVNNSILEESEEQE